jgi:hypothetical protein
MKKEVWRIDKISPRSMISCVCLERATLNDEKILGKSRSGRIRLKPLQFWKNEHIIYERRLSGKVSKNKPRGEMFQPAHSLVQVSIKEILTIASPEQQAAKRKRNIVHREQLVEKGFTETNQTSVMVYDSTNNKECEMGRSPWYQ